MLTTAERRRRDYRDNVNYVFGATAELYYAYWGEFFHFAVFHDGDDTGDFDSAFERTHQRYCAAIRGSEARRILELATGGGAFAEWLAVHTEAEVVGVDLSDTQLAHAHARLKARPRRNLRFLKHDAMWLEEIDEPTFDAALCLDAACYFPDKLRALRGVATRVRASSRFLLVDWCRAERPSVLEQELVLEPFYRLWGIPEMETVNGYTRGFETAGFRLISVTDLSTNVAPNWERAYRLGLQALSQLGPVQLRRMAAVVMRYGPGAVQLAKNQFYAVLLAKAAADTGALRYVEFVGERIR